MYNSLFQIVNTILTFSEEEIVVLTGCSESSFNVCKDCIIWSKIEVNGNAINFILGSNVEIYALMSKFLFFINSRIVFAWSVSH